MEGAAEKLAAVVLGELIGLENPDAAWGFVGGQILAAPIEEIGFGDNGAVVEFDGRGGNLAFLFVRQAEGGGASDGGMGDDGFFQLADVDGVTAGLDHVFHAADEADHAETIAGGEIAGAEPTVGSEQGWGLGVAMH